jgi:hypothetical protein
MSRWIPRVSTLQRSKRPDCVAGHVRLELRNVAANYPFERSRRFPRTLANSSPRDYSRLSCGGGETQLGPSAGDLRWRSGSRRIADISRFSTDDQQRLSSGALGKCSDPNAAGLDAGRHEDQFRLAARNPCARWWGHHYVSRWQGASPLSPHQLTLDQLTSRAVARFGKREVEVEAPTASGHLRYLVKE